MRRIVLTNHLTLDGVMQAPGRPDEDPRGGFDHGGWAIPDNDEVMGRVMGEGMADGGAMLFGRRTYEDFFSNWANQTDNPFTEVLDRTEKYVVSTTLQGPLPWANSTLLQGDTAAAIAALKEAPGKDITVLGSGELAQTLMQHNLIDRYVLMIHPVVLGTGTRLFRDDGPSVPLTLVDSVTTTKGVVIGTYEPTASRA
jgi:dihydrofolate reductase